MLRCRRCHRWLAATPPPPSAHSSLPRTRPSSPASEGKDGRSFLAPHPPDVARIRPGLVHSRATSAAVPSLPSMPSAAGSGAARPGSAEPSPAVPQSFLSSKTFSSGGIASVYGAAAAVAQQERQRCIRSGSGASGATPPVTHSSIADPSTTAICSPSLPPIITALEKEMGKRRTDIGELLPISRPISCRFAEEKGKDTKRAVTSPSGQTPPKAVPGLCAVIKRQP